MRSFSERRAKSRRPEKKIFEDVFTYTPLVFIKLIVTNLTTNGEKTVPTNGEKTLNLSTLR